MPKLSHPHLSLETNYSNPASVQATDFLFLMHTSPHTHTLKQLYIRFNPQPDRGILHCMLNNLPHAESGVVSAWL